MPSTHTVGCALPAPVCLEHIDHLFTFQDHPMLNIPNTTNALDGSFKKAKLALGIHSGLSPEHKQKLVLSLLRAHE